MDVMQVYEASKEAMDFIRKEGQPYFLEVDTYRFRGHSMGDPERYRKAEEVKKWQENDPIGIFNKYLLDKKIATTKSLDEIEARVEEEVVKAVEFAETSPEPAMEELFTDIYVDN
jgi:pyruvate dehydrogenase E1 component alpha subunit